MEQKELQRKAGHIQQLCHIRKVRFEGEAADQQTAYLVENGKLSFAISASLGMDMADLRYGGVNLCHITKPGWLVNSIDQNNFIPGGMFFTCGLKNVGPQTAREPVHGKQRFLPAENSAQFVGFEDGSLQMRLYGEVREAGLFSKNLLRKRTITTEYNSRRIVIHDEIENQGFGDEEIMLLYHFNTGYPLLDEGAEFVAPSQTARFRSAG